ncbi:MAG: hypothetical protein ACRDRX_24365 [Pseudonocardiaceae bacterium]
MTIALRAEDVLCGEETARHECDMIDRRRKDSAVFAPTGASSGVSSPILPCPSTIKKKETSQLGPAGLDHSKLE